MVTNLGPQKLTKLDAYNAPIRIFYLINLCIARCFVFLFLFLANIYDPIGATHECKTAF